MMWGKKRKKQPESVKIIGKKKKKVRKKEREKKKSLFSLAEDQSLKKVTVLWQPNVTENLQPHYQIHQPKLCEEPEFHLHQAKVR